MLPFIEKYHKTSEVLFWPDLATIHYQKDVKQWLVNSGIEFVSKEGNAPNVPQTRPIERFWYFCKVMYSKRTTAPKNLRGFKIIWRNISQNVSQTFAQSLMKNIRRRLKLIGDKGVFAPFK